MEDGINIVNFISSSLDSEKYNDALNAFKKKYKEPFGNYCWEVLATAISKIEADTIIIKPSLYGTCEKIISVVLEHCTPDDALLEFIERLELARNDAQFGIILPAIQQLLKKLMIHKKRSIEWCLYTISSYIDKIELKEHYLEEDERKLIDSDPNARRVVKVYTIIISFYQPIIDEILEPNIGAYIKTKKMVTDFLISLLGKPMIFIDIDPNANAMSEARQVCQTIIRDICKLEKDVLKFLQVLEHKEKCRPQYTDGDKVSELETTERMNMTTYGGFFYVVYSGHFEIPESALPQVYRSEYVVHTLLLAVKHLLEYSEYGPLAKALALYQALNNRLCENTSHELLASSVHFDLCRGLVKIAIYCNYQTLRKNALKSIRDHINKFDYKGKYTLIKYLIEATNHSGMIGYAINMYKDYLNEAFNEPVLNECFYGVKLRAMVDKMCLLPHGAETDLMEMADQIITTLNFLRFLVLKDKENKSGIGDIIPRLRTDYLDVLGTAIKMSRAHYELKLKDIIEGKDEPDVTLNVGGNVLNSIPPERKKMLVESALNAFHLIEGLSARLNECITSSVSE